MSLAFIDLLPTFPEGVATRPTIPLWLTTPSRISNVCEMLPPGGAQWLTSHRFNGERLRTLSIPAADGHIAAVVVGLGAQSSHPMPDCWFGAALPERLPAGSYHLASPLPDAVATQFLYGWLSGQYQPATRFKSASSQPPAAALLPPDNANVSYARHAAAAVTVARELINAPANVLGPQELAHIARELCAVSDGRCEVQSGTDLERNFPLVHAVGMGSSRAPCLIDCRWPRDDAPLVTVVGKGVCFDSGGLDIKAAPGMLLMKKDMGGAACALALAHLLRALNAPVSLRVLIPAVENAVSGNAYRPGDVWTSRKGLRVEIGNTDAEGRLILADALAAADDERPDLLIDLSTLTGAARIALGPELPAVFSNRKALLEAIVKSGEICSDPVWPMPLWDGYDDELSSRVGDINNVATSPFAGAVIAALFLRRFVSAQTAWMHFDLYGWNAKDRPGRPLGAEAQCVRALYAMLRTRYG